LTYYGRIIAKDNIYKNGAASREVQGIFAKQVERIRWLNKLAPATLNIKQGETVTEIEVIEITQTAETLDKRVLPLIVKAIPYNLVFVLICEAKMQYAVSYNGRVYASDTAPKLLGNDTDSVWDNFVRQISGTIIAEGNTLEAQIAADEERAKLLRRIEQLERQARSERQPRRKWELAEEVKRLRAARERY
jgi:hypothetical protein